MKVLLALISLTYACVQELIVPPSLSSDASTLPFTQLLQTTTCSSVQIRFTTMSSSLIAISTLGHFEAFQMDCAGNTLEIVQSLKVETETTVNFWRCGFNSAIEEVMMEVEGKTELIECWVNGLQGRGFEVTGELKVTHSHFEANTNSIFSLPSFGCVLTILNSKFEKNTSPQGTILFLQPSGTQSNSTTSVCFDRCEFLDNSAEVVGSFMYVVAGHSDFTSAQSREARALSITNSLFVNSPGYLWYLQLRHLNASFHNNTIQNVENPIFLALLDSAFRLFNTSFQQTSRPFFCSYVGGLVLIDGIQIETVSNGPALMILNQAPFGLGQVVIRNVDMAMVNQVDFKWFVSTIYSLAVSITVENVLVHSGFCFAAACGAYFFSVSAVDHCTVTNTTVVQGGLIGHVFGQGTAKNLNMTDTNSIIGGCFLILGANIAFRNLTLVISEGYSMPTLDGMYSFHDGNASLTDAYAYVPSARNHYLVEADNEELYLARLYWNKVEAITLLKIARSQVVAEELSADTVDLVYFASVNTESKLELRNIRLHSPHLSGGFISATTLCNITATDISVSGGKVGALVSSFHSHAQVARIQLWSVHSDVLFVAYLSSVLTVSNLTLQQFTGDLMSSVHSSVLLSAAVLTDVTSNRGLLHLRFSEVNWRAVHMTGFVGTSISSFCSSHSSTLTVHNSSILSLLSREQGLCYLIDSSLVIHFTTIHLFNATFLQLHRTYFDILNSTISTGGLQLMSKGAKVKASAGFMKASDSSGNIRGSLFKDISGVNGGCIALTSSGTRRGQVSVSWSVFESCRAEEKGGVIYAVGISVDIEQTEMNGNQGREGGSLYFECETNKTCSCQMRHVIYTSNSATNGGVVKWTKVRPHLINITSEDNKAEYGNFEASIPTHTVLLNSDTQYMKGVPGVVVVQPILIGFLDAVGQIVKTDNQSSAELLSGNLVGTTYVLATNGIANFSGVIVQTQPGTSVLIDVLSPSISQTFPESPPRSVITYDTRVCVPGEVTSAVGCFLCPSLSFSVNPMEKECRACPSYATCSGGMYLYLDPGYWRASELRSDVYICPVKSSCLGGQNSTCAEGYSDKLCGKCAKGFYLVGLSSCTACESMAVRGTRIAVFLLVVLALYVLFVRKSPATAVEGKSVAVMTTFKILLNFIHSVMMISIINVDWREALTGLFSAVEMFLSLAISSFSLECFWRKFHTDGEMAPVYLKAAFALSLPFGLLLLNISVFVILYHLRLSRNAFRRCCQSSLMILGIIHPYVIKTTVQLVSCKEVDSNTLWLSADMSVQCWTTSHYTYVLLLFIPTLIVYIIGVPLLFAGLLAKLRTSVYSNFLVYLTTGYQEKYGYWEVVVTVRKALLLLTLSLLGSTVWIIQNLVAMVLLYVALEWHLRTSPYADSIHNKLETSSLFLQLAVISCSFYFNADLMLNQSIQLALGILLFVLLALFVVLCLAIIIAQMLLKRKIRTAIHPEAQDMELSAAKVPPTPFASLESSINVSANAVK